MRAAFCHTVPLLIAALRCAWCKEEEAPWLPCHWICDLRQCWNSCPDSQSKLLSVQSCRASSQSVPAQTGNRSLLADGVYSRRLAKQQWWPEELENLRTSVEEAEASPRNQELCGGCFQLAHAPVARRPRFSEYDAATGTLRLFQWEGMWDVRSFAPFPIHAYRRHRWFARPVRRQGLGPAKVYLPGRPEIVTVARGATARELPAERQFAVLPPHDLDVHITPTRQVPKRSEDSRTTPAVSVDAWSVVNPRRKSIVAVILDGASHPAFNVFSPQIQEALGAEGTLHTFERAYLDIIPCGSDIIRTTQFYLRLWFGLRSDFADRQLDSLTLEERASILPLSARQNGYVTAFIRDAQLPFEHPPVAGTTNQWGRVHLNTSELFDSMGPLPFTADDNIDNQHRSSWACITPLLLEYAQRWRGEHAAHPQYIHIHLHASKRPECGEVAERHLAPWLLEQQRLYPETLYLVGSDHGPGPGHWPSAHFPFWMIRPPRSSQWSPTNTKALVSAADLHWTLQGYVWGSYPPPLPQRVMTEWSSADLLEMLQVLRVRRQSFASDLAIDSQKRLAAEGSYQTAEKKRVWADLVVTAIDLIMTEECRLGFLPTREMRMRDLLLDTIPHRRSCEEVAPDPPTCEMLQQALRQASVDSDGIPTSSHSLIPRYLGSYVPFTGLSTAGDEESIRSLIEWIEVDMRQRLTSFPWCARLSVIKMVGTRIFVTGAVEMILVLDPIQSLVSVVLTTPDADIAYKNRDVIHVFKMAPETIEISYTSLTRFGPQEHCQNNAPRQLCVCDLSVEHRVPTEQMYWTAWLSA